MDAYWGEIEARWLVLGWLHEPRPHSPRHLRLGLPGAWRTGICTGHGAPYAPGPGLPARVHSVRAELGRDHVANPPNASGRGIHGGEVHRSQGQASSVPRMWHQLDKRIVAARQKRWLLLCVVYLRIGIGLAFLPASLKKLLGQPFTDADKIGIFHDFLRSFHAVDGFYQFVGAMQLLVATLLLTQRFATVGAALALPLLAAIGALCWSSAGIPTITVVTLMTLGAIGLLLWEVDRWRALFGDEEKAVQIEVRPPEAWVDHRLWRQCGVAIIVVYVATTLAQGEVYRPRGVELDRLGFYLLPTIMLFPIVTWLIDRSRYRARRGPAAD